MAKTLTEAKITTREQRKKLPIGVHWRGIDPEVHLGYRKGKRGGKWLVRWYIGDEDYRQRTFATADDELPEGTLDFDDAVREARNLVAVERRKARAAAEGPLLTVRNAVETYSAARDARDTARKGRPVRSDATSRLTRYVTGQQARGKRKEVEATALAEIALYELSESDLLAWRAALPGALKGTTKQRLINDLKAALNEAFAANRSRLPATFPATIKHALRALNEGDGDADEVARENQILSDVEVARLLGAARDIDAEQGWEGDLFRLVLVLAATGARFSQIARLRVGDVQVKAQRLFVPVSRKGRGSKSGGTPVPIGADVLEALMPALKGRASQAPLLERWRSKQVAGGIRWERVGRGSWQSASELVRPWAAIRERAKMSEVISYALRHTSIVRGIRANLPIRLVAALHDTSVAMIERHYGRFVADGLDELAARSVVPLVPQRDDGDVVSLPQRA
ncbi:tyrosine-type recombinase/integrase [Sphingomonas sp. NSE70-1]|uniref:Tyrosine-type recombinase/integrase n=1 Tax=Sphingomonas caseinilyticus TaxID=2908205 RepID=A0ABT0RTG8_9SPHN|nr:tyrosine-type recombinase/integrase [Sphingomonas caseinilyticus]MCL6698293.1 tyrosine-type recombinase/integrase [Sphingomonas caseinilyticus]